MEYEKSIEGIIEDLGLAKLSEQYQAVEAQEIKGIKKLYWKVTHSSAIVLGSLAMIKGGMWLGGMITFEELRFYSACFILGIYPFFLGAVLHTGDYKKPKWFHWMYTKTANGKKNFCLEQEVIAKTVEMSESVLLRDKKIQLELLEYIEGRQSVVSAQDMTNYISYKEALISYLEKGLYGNALHTLVYLYPLFNGKEQIGYMQKLREEVNKSNPIPLVKRL